MTLDILDELRPFLEFQETGHILTKLTEESNKNLEIEGMTIDQYTEDGTTKLISHMLVNQT